MHERRWKLQRRDKTGSKLATNPNQLLLCPLNRKVTIPIRFHLFVIEKSRDSGELVESKAKFTGFPSRRMASARRAQTRALSIRRPSSWVSISNGVMRLTTSLRSQLFSSNSAGWRASKRAQCQCIVGLERKCTPHARRHTSLALWISCSVNCNLMKDN